MRPKHKDGLQRVRERVALMYCSNKRRGDEHRRCLAISGQRDELVYGPVLEHKSQAEHEHPQRVVNYCCRWRLPVMEASPQHTEEFQGEPVD